MDTPDLILALLRVILWLTVGGVLGYLGAEAYHRWMDPR